MHQTRVIRKFERFLFKGVPDQPESTFERDGNTYANSRQTGKSQVDFAEDNTEAFEVIGTFIYDFEQKKETYVSKVE